MLFRICAALFLLAGLATAKPCDGTSQTITAHKFARYEAAAGNFGGQPVSGSARPPWLNEISSSDPTICTAWIFRQGQ